MISMQESDGSGGDDVSILTRKSATVEYMVKATPEARKAAKAIGRRLIYDPRWSIRMISDGRDMDWWIVDTGAPLKPIEIEGAETGITYKSMAVLGHTEPRLTPAESREQAIELLESLREGLVSYDDLTFEDIDNDEDLEEGLDEDDSLIDYYGEDEDEGEDFAEDDSDPRFEWEKRKGISVEDIDPEDEQRKREAWVMEDPEGEAV